MGEKGRAEVLEGLAEGGPGAAAPTVVVRGHHGSGRTALLADLARHRPVVMARAVSLDRDAPPESALDVLAAAFGRAVTDAVSATDVAGWLDGTALAIDDAHWLGDRAWDLVCTLVGAVPLVVTFADERPSSADRIDELEARGARTVTLEPLDDSAAANLLAALSVTEGERALVMAAAGGNPALLAAGSPGAWPPLVADALDARLGALGPAGVTAAALLHLSGGTAASSLLDADGRAALDRLGLLRQSGTRVSLTQGALGQAATERLADEERKALHRRLAALAADAEAARHLEQAGDFDQAAWHALAAAVDAPPVLRADLLELVSRCRPNARDPALERDLAASLIAVGRMADAIEPATASGSGGLAARALRMAGRVEEACGLLIATEPEDAVAAAEAAWIERWPGVSGLRPTDYLGTGAVDIETIDEALEGSLDLSEVPDRVAQLAADQEWDLAASVGLAGALLAAARGDVKESAGAIEHLTEVLAVAPAGPWHGSAETVRAAVALHAGEAPAPLSDALSVLVDRLHPLPGLAAAHLALALADSGRASDALAAIKVVRATPRRPVALDAAVLAWAEAEVELLAGRPRKARRAISALDELPSQGGFGAMVRALRGVTEAWIAFDLAEPLPSSAHGLAQRELTGLAKLAADDPSAAADLDQAAQDWVSERAARRTRWAAAEARRRAGDLTTAVEQLRVLEAESEALGLLPTLARVRQSLRRAGVAIRPSAPAPSPSDGAGPLSPRESEVMDLVAQGLSSAEIADRVGRGRSTIETQISSAMRKLGARTRRQAAALHLQGTMA